MEISRELRAAIAYHAGTEYPREACGLIVHDGTQLLYVAGRNISNTPTQDFRLDPRDWIAAEAIGQVRAVVHSHPDASFAPSTADRAMIDAGHLPWVIISMPDAMMSVNYPSGRGTPLVGRQFIHGSLDCFTLLRDYYRYNLGIALPDVWHAYDWWQEGENLYLDHCTAAGFEQVESPRLHDVVLMKIASRVPNHVGIYTGDGRILHHMANQLSRHDTYGGIWQRATHGFYRHRDTR
jgi:proteasome lid subunit RPN8/RPN11